uniref:small monomeric GTPase n=1 Tax=Arcella intermedia TaxID=1963864 RepID=A0A6B2LAF5_9EUKA
MTGIFPEYIYVPTCASLQFLKQLQLSSGKMMDVELWETCYFSPSFINLYCSQCTHALLIFSITSITSFDAILPIYQLFLQHEKGKNIRFLLVGNKTDLEDKRKITKQQGEKLAAKIGCKYVEMSVKLGTNLNEAVLQLVDHTIPPYEPQKTFNSLISSDLNYIFNNPTLSDLKINIPGHPTIHLHKTLLSVRYPTFLQFFDTSNEFTQTHLPYNHLLEITQCIYTGTLNYTDAESLKPTIQSLQLLPLLSLLKQPSPATFPSPISFLSSTTHPLSVYPNISAIQNLPCTQSDIGLQIPILLLHVYKWL